MTDVSEADFDVQHEGQVEIIGWLYQYYNEEPHNAVVNINGGAVKKSDIPAATQLFTTDWVVRYMVDNSLGRFYLEHNGDSAIAEKLDYLLPGELTPADNQIELDQIKVLDNAMGSGHILVYAFDVLMEMYLEQGYSNRDAAISIIKHNLFGLEIDRRAYQLAYFALMMKLRQYHRRALTMNIVPNIYVFEDTDNISKEDIDGLAVASSIKQDLTEIANDFANARMLGSIIKLNRNFDVPTLKNELTSALAASSLDIFGTNQKIVKLLDVVDIVNVLQTKFEVVVTNPPYLNRMDKPLKDYVKKNYNAYSGDMFSVFIWINVNMTVKNGYSAYMTPFVWMFIKTYEALRIAILDQFSISSLVQMEYSAFEEATVPINTFVLKNSSTEHVGTYIKLSDFKGGMEIQRQRVIDAINNPELKYVYRTNQTNFEKIPGSPIVYWAPRSLIQDFVGGLPMDKVVKPKVGLQTGDNNRFLRQWFEVGFDGIKFDATSINDSVLSNKKWFPYNKGGSFRKWYGNYDYVVNWEHDGREIRNFRDDKGKLRSRPQNTDYYFREAITWSDVNSGHFSLRYREPGSIHDVKGMSAFSITNENDSSLFWILGLMNSPIGDYVFNMLNPTISLQVGNFQTFPVLNASKKIRNISEKKSIENIKLTRADWNVSELSWDFTTLSFLTDIADHKQPPP